MMRNTGSESAERGPHRGTSLAQLPRRAQVTRARGPGCARQTQKELKGPTFIPFPLPQGIGLNKEHTQQEHGVHPGLSLGRTQESPHWVRKLLLKTQRDRCIAASQRASGNTRVQILFFDFPLLSFPHLGRRSHSLSPPVAIFSGFPHRNFGWLAVTPSRFPDSHLTLSWRRPGPEPSLTPRVE